LFRFRDIAVQQYSDIAKPWHVIARDCTIVQGCGWRVRDITPPFRISLPSGFVVVFVIIHVLIILPASHPFL
jgi:hypothetical protein